MQATERYVLGWRFRVNCWLIPVMQAKDVPAKTSALQPTNGRSRQRWASKSLGSTRRRPCKACFIVGTNELDPAVLSE